ncbi:unnamed protein product [Rhizoctonia solani]|uniref:Uncharacterized protein n=1 Tax=Rhizoctonia solani TaxID=456999 RepID=A0A8H2ZX48_9AGAM|nr:unnamed protein product [Rhizoctonia solani]
MVETLDIEATSQALHTLGRQTSLLPEHPAIAVEGRLQRMLEALERLEEGQRVTNQILTRLENRIVTLQRIPSTR